MSLSRLGLSILLGATATFALFFLMQWLIAHPGRSTQEEVYGQVIDFVRVREDSEARRRERKPPKKIAEPEPKPPDLDMAHVPKPRNAALTSTAVNLDFQLAGSLGLGGAPSDSDVIPLVRIDPTYPGRALSRGIEGWVLLEFTITPLGTVQNVVVVDAEPPSMFNSAAQRAVRRWKYRPRIEDGSAVTRTGVQVVLTFKIKD